MTPPTRATWLWPLAIFVLALAVRALHLRESLAGPLMRGEPPMIDSRYYDKEAREIAAGDWLGDEVFYLAPLYPYSLGVVYALVGTDAGSDPIRTARWVQACFGALACVLVYAIGVLAFDRRVGVVAGLLAAGYGFFLYYDGLLMPSSQVLFVHLGSVLALLWAARAPSPARWLLGGLMLGLAAASQGTALLWALVAVLWVLVDRSGPARRERAARAAWILAGLLPLVATITVRNWVVGRDLVLLTSNAGKNLWIGNHPGASGLWELLPEKDVWGSGLDFYIKDVPRGADDPSPSESSRYFRTKAIAFAREHPGEAARLAARKLALFLNAVEAGSRDQFYFARRYSTPMRTTPLSFGLLVPIGLTGLALSMRRRGRACGLLALAVLAQVAAFVPFFVVARYRVVAVALLLVFAAAQVLWWIERGRARDWRAIGASAAVYVAFLGLVHLPLEGVTPTRGFGRQLAEAGGRHVDAGELEAGRRCLEEALEHDFFPRTDPFLERARCHVVLGEIDERQGDRASALERFRAAQALLEQEDTGAEGLRAFRRYVRQAIARVTDG